MNSKSISRFQFGRVVTSCALVMGSSFYSLLMAVIILLMCSEGRVGAQATQMNWVPFSGKGTYTVTKKLPNASPTNVIGTFDVCWQDTTHFKLAIYGIDGFIASQYGRDGDDGYLWRRDVKAEFDELDVWSAPSTNRPIRDQMLRFLSETLFEPYAEVTNSERYIRFDWFQSDNFTNITVSADEQFESGTLTHGIQIFGQIKSDTLSRTVPFGEVLIYYAQPFRVESHPRAATLTLFWPYTANIRPREVVWSYSYSLTNYATIAAFRREHTEPVFPRLVTVDDSTFSNAGTPRYYNITTNQQWKSRLPLPKIADTNNSQAVMIYKRRRFVVLLVILLVTLLPILFFVVSKKTKKQKIK